MIQSGLKPLPQDSGATAAAGDDVSAA
jgi:hypothetical protein